MGWDVDTRYALAYLVSCLFVSVFLSVICLSIISWHGHFCRGYIWISIFIEFVIRIENGNRDGKRDENITADIEDRCVRDMYVCVYVCI